jgi:hypothetical protein
VAVYSLDVWIDPRRRPTWKHVYGAEMAVAAGHLTQQQLDRAWATAHGVRVLMTWIDRPQELLTWAGPAFSGPLYEDQLAVYAGSDIVDLAASVIHGVGMLASRASMTGGTAVKRPLRMSIASFTAAAVIFSARYSDPARMNRRSVASSTRSRAATLLASAAAAALNVAA